MLLTGIGVRRPRSMGSRIVQSFYFFDGIINTNVRGPTYIVIPEHRCGSASLSQQTAEVYGAIWHHEWFQGPAVGLTAPIQHATMCSTRAIA